MRAGMLLASWIGLSGCVGAAPPESAGRAITDGTLDETDVAVVALLSGGTPVCTGTLVAPDAVLTAAHCVTPDPPDAVAFGAAPDAGADVAAVIAVVAHPAFDHEHLTDDIALVRLASPALAAPVPLLRAASRDDLVGRPVRIAGFGLTSADAPAAEPVRRRSGTSTIADADDTTFRFGPEPSQTCMGDSGGPTFVLDPDGVELLAGVHSAGDPDCAWAAIDTRVDAYVGGFLEPELATPAAAAWDSGALVGHCAALPGQARGAAPWTACLALALVVATRQRRPYFQSKR